MENIHIDVIVSADLIGDRLNDFNQLILLLFQSRVDLNIYVELIKYAILTQE